MSAQAGGLRTQQRLFSDTSTGALNAETLISDLDTGETSFTPRNPNRIIDVTHDIDPAAGLVRLLKTRRQERRRLLGSTPNFLTTFTGDKRPGMPIDLAPGFFQYVEVPVAGALTDQNYLVTYQNPLNL